MSGAPVRTGKGKKDPLLEEAGEISAFGGNWAGRLFPFVGKAGGGGGGNGRLSALSVTVRSPKIVEVVEPTAPLASCFRSTRLLRPAQLPFLLLLGAHPPLLSGARCVSPSLAS